MKIAGKRILITGGGSGIGRALAGAFLKKGGTIVICGRRSSALSEVKQEFSGVFTIQADITDPADVQRLYDEITGMVTSIDVLVNNAGAITKMDFAKDIPDSVVNEINTNLVAPLALIKKFLPMLLNAQEAAIINVSSGYALWPNKTTPVYSATKAAMHSLTKSLRWQLENTNIQVFEVLPPVIKTPSALHEGGMDADIFAQKVIRNIEAGNKEIVAGDVRWLRMFRGIFPFVMDEVLKRR